LGGASNHPCLVLLLLMRGPDIRQHIAKINIFLWSVWSPFRLGFYQCCVLALWLVLLDLALHDHFKRRTAWHHSTLQAGYTLARRGSLEGSPPAMLGAHSSPELRLKFGPVKATYHRQVTLLQVTSAAFRSRGLSFRYIRAVAILASDRRDTTG
jgi:hypothetical protein